MRRRKVENASAFFYSGTGSMEQRVVQVFAKGETAECPSVYEGNSILLYVSLYLSKYRETKLEGKHLRSSSGWEFNLNDALRRSFHGLLGNRFAAQRRTSTAGLSAERRDCGKNKNPIFRFVSHSFLFSNAI